MEPIWLLLIPLITAFSLFIIDLYSAKLMRIVTVISGGVNLLLAINTLLEVIKNPVVYNLSGWNSKLGINLVIDPLSGILITLITFISLGIIYYSLDYIRESQRKYYMLLLLLITGMIGLVATGDLFNLYVFVELTSITSYALVAFEKKDISIEASFKYMILGSISGVLVLLAIILIYHSTGTLNLAQLVVQSQSIPEITKKIILALFIVGFGTKFALVPLHSWLPDAHPAAPSPISALLSGVVIKVYLYALLRNLFTLFRLQELLALDLDIILTYIGVVTLLVGHLLAYQQKNLKRVLAYSSISQIGYIMIGIGLFNVAGLEASVYHIINHAVVKGLLFLTAGIFVFKTGKSNIYDLKGIAYQLPLNSFIFTIAALNIVGLPPFNSFISKWLLTNAAIEANFIIPAAFIPLGSILSLIYYLKIIRLLYTNLDYQAKIIAVSLRLVLPTVCLSIACLLLAFQPKLVLITIKQISKFLLEPSNYSKLLLGGEKWALLSG
ncbi:proton-conducting transporter membrane subunit [Halanaerocella petrolearia]